MTQYAREQLEFLKSRIQKENKRKENKERLSNIYKNFTTLDYPQKKKKNFTTSVK